MVKNLPGIQKTWVQSLRQEDPLEKETATHSSIFTWEIPLQGNLAGYSSWDHKRVGYSLVTKQQENVPDTVLGNQRTKETEVSVLLRTQFLMGGEQTRNTKDNK